LLQSLIAFQLLLKHVEDFSEEACDADSIYVILPWHIIATSVPRWGFTSAMALG